MKRHLAKRVATAMALAGLAAASTSCGSNNNNNPLANLPGFANSGASLNQAAGGCSYALVGTYQAYGDGLYANLQASLVGTGQVQGGTFQFGRVAADGTTLAFNIYNNQVQGVLSLSQAEVYAIGGGGMGGMYGGAMGMGCPSASNVTLYNVAYQNSAQASQVVGSQAQSFSYILYSGVVSVNGMPLSSY